MATPSEFVQSNKRLRAPEGHEEIVSPLPVYTDDRQTVSCWYFSDEEIANIIKTRCAFVNISWPGGTQPPVFVWSGELREGLF